MTVFEKLRAVTEAARHTQDLPDFLAARIFRILDDQEHFRSREDEIDELAEKITIYDTYSQAGYLGMGVNHTILDKTLKRLEQRG